MNTYRHRLITQKLALLPSKRLIFVAARDAHRQQGPLARPSGALSSSTNTVAASKP